MALCGVHSLGLSLDECSGTALWFLLVTDEHLVWFISNKTRKTFYGYRLFDTFCWVRTVKNRAWNRRQHWCVSEIKRPLWLILTFLHIVQAYGKLLTSNQYIFIYLFIFTILSTILTWSCTFNLTELSGCSTYRYEAHSGSTLCNFHLWMFELFKMIFNMTGYGLDTYTAVKEFEIGKILQWFWKKYLLLIEAVFIWSKRQ